MLLKSFYTVVSQQVKGSLITTDIVFNTDHAIYKGHFPDHPITPGVCILQTAKQLMESHLECSLKVVQVPNVKFLKLVFPDNHKVLQYNIELQQEEDATLTALINLKDKDEVLYTRAIVNFRH